MSKYDEVLRPFVALMEKELHANSHKGDREGWLQMTEEQALGEIEYHVSKLSKAMTDMNPDGVREYAADVANLCMMLLDIGGQLKADPNPPQPIYDEAVNAAVLGAKNLNAAMETIDMLRSQLAERDALLTDLGLEPDSVSDVYQRLLLNADRYEYLREHMTVEDFPAPHPEWSHPSESESRRIDDLCDSAMSRAKSVEVDHE